MPTTTRSDTQARWKYDLLLLAIVLVWGINFPILKAALEVMPMMVVNAFRFTVSVLTLGLLYGARQRKSEESFWKPMRLFGKQILALGFLVFVCYQLMFIVGLNNTTSGNGALIMASAPLWTALLGYYLGYERLTPAAWTGLLVSLGGTALVIVGGPKEVDLSSSTLFGNLLMAGAALFWGAYTALNKPVLRNVTPTALTFFGLLFMMPVLYGVAVPYFDAVQWTDVDAWVWLAIVFSGALSTGLAIALWSVCVRHVGSSETAAFNNLVPLVAVGSGVLILSEPVNAAQLAGGALIIGGLYLMRRTRRSAIQPDA